MSNNVWKFWIFFVLSLGMVHTALAADVNVYAAASLTDSLKELGAMYEKQTQNKIVFNFAASNLLARQISEGAPADLFWSADEAKMDQLHEKRLLVEETRQSFLSNQLVIVVPIDSKWEFKSAKDLARPEVRRIALAQPQSVPAGIYAKQYLQTIGLWDALENNIIPTENVRAALAAVESGNVDAAIVYKTDALISKKAKTAYEVPVSEGPAISYPVALLRTAVHPEEAKNLLIFLQSAPALEIFRKFGFIVSK